MADEADEGGCDVTFCNIETGEEDRSDQEMKHDIDEVGHTLIDTELVSSHLIVDWAVCLT